MATLEQIRAGLKAQLATISGLETSAKNPPKVNPPHAVVGAPERVVFDSGFQDSGHEWIIPIRVYVARADDIEGQTKLDSYFAGAASTSVKEAIEADVTLGGVVDTVRVTEARGYGNYDVGGVLYLGCEWLVEVLD